MKTAMQVTIDKMNEAKENLPPFGFHDEFLRGFNKAFQMAVFIAEKNGLEAEKEQIIKAWDNGNTCGTDEIMGGMPEFYVAEHYYQQTFKSDE